MKIDIIFLLCIFIIMANVSESSYYFFLEQKLVGGVRTLPKQKNFMASFKHNDSQLCSGILISQNHVLIAAHCLDDFMTKPTIPNFREYCIELGYYDWSTLEVRHSIKEMEVNVRYNPFSYDPAMDIGLITLMRPVTPSDYINWINLIKHAPQINSEAEILGWGSHANNERLTVLKKIKVVIVPNTKCNCTITTSIVCAALNNEHDILTQIDIGAPLIQNDVIVGILAKILKNDLAIFANVPNSLDYIGSMKVVREMRYSKALPRRRAHYGHACYEKGTHKRKFFLLNETE